MGQLKDTSIFSRCDYSAVCKAADDLADQACVLSARYLKDGTLRLQFNREVFCYGRGIVMGEVLLMKLRKAKKALSRI